MAASARRESSLKVSLGDLYATRCATCARTLVIDEISWAVDPDAEAGTAAEPQPIARHYRCTVCRDQRGGGEQRQAPLDEEDLVRSTPTSGSTRSAPPCRPVPGGPRAEDLTDELLDLHTPRQLVGPRPRSSSDRERPAGRAGRWPRCAWRCCTRSFPASRLRCARPARRRCGSPAATSLPASDNGASATRGSPSRTGSGSSVASSSGCEGGAPARSRRASARTCAASGRGPRPPSLPCSSPSGLRARSETSRPPNGRGRRAARPARPGPAPRPARLERLAAAYHATAWVLGREAAVPAADRALAGNVAAAAVELAGRLARSLRRGAVMARDGRAVLLVDGGPEALAAGVLGGAGAGYRLVGARLADGDDDIGGSSSSCRPARPCRPAPRTRANVVLAAVPGGAGDPDLVPGRGLFAPPERFDQRPFSPAEAARDRDRGRGRDAARPRRARPLRAAARRGARRPGPGRPAAPARDARARTRERLGAAATAATRSPTRRRPTRRRPTRPIRAMRPAAAPGPAARTGPTAAASARPARRRASRSSRRGSPRPGSPRPTRSSGCSR